MLSTLYYFVVKGKFIWAKQSLPPVGIEPATPTPSYFDPNAYPSVLNPISCKIETLKILIYSQALLILAKSSQFL